MNNLTQIQVMHKYYALDDKSKVLSRISDLRKVFTGYSSSYYIVKAMNYLYSLNGKYLIEPYQPCKHVGTTIAWGPDADKCTKCDLTWNV